MSEELQYCNGNVIKINIKNSSYVIYEENNLLETQGSAIYNLKYI